MEQESYVSIEVESAADSDPLIPALAALTTVEPVDASLQTWKAGFVVGSEDGGTDGQLSLTVQGLRDPLFTFIDQAAIGFRTLALVDSKPYGDGERRVDVFLAKDGAGYVCGYRDIYADLERPGTLQVDLTFTVETRAPAGFVAEWIVVGSLEGTVDERERDRDISLMDAEGAAATTGLVASRQTLSGSYYWEAKGAIKLKVVSKSSAIDYIGGGGISGTAWTGSNPAIGIDWSSISRRSGANPVVYYVSGYDLH